MELGQIMLIKAKTLVSGAQGGSLVWQNLNATRKLLSSFTFSYGDKRLNDPFRPPSNTAMDSKVFLAVWSAGQQLPEVHTFRISACGLPNLSQRKAHERAYRCSASRRLRTASG